MNYSENCTYTEVLTADQVTDEILALAVSIEEGWVLLDRLEDAS